MRICYGRPLWVAVTREQFIAAVIRNREKEVEKQRTDMRTFEQERQTQLAGREEWIRELRKVYEQTEKDPARREKLLEDVLKLAALIDARMAKAVQSGSRRNRHPPRGTWPPGWVLRTGACRGPERP